MLLVLCLIISITLSMSIHYNDSIKWIVESTTLTKLPIVFYPNENIALAPLEIYYYKIYQCSGVEGDSSNKQAQLSIILPNNVVWDTDDGYLLAELSTSPNQWDSNHVFATNYVWNSQTGVPKLYNNVTWTYNSTTTLNNSYFYLRITARIVQTVGTFELTYVSTTNLITGTYDIHAFNAPTYSDDFHAISQFARTTSAEQVANNDILLLQVVFCAKDISGDTYSLYYTVVADPNYPQSAANTFICPANYGTNCNLNTACAVNYKSGAVGVIEASSTNQACDITNGILFGIFGFGGSFDGKNYFDVGITISD